MELHKLLFSSFFLITALTVIFTASIEVVEGGSYGGSNFRELFVFGDSYADTGNDPSLPANSWKVPYGITFPGKPTGRCSDGRVLTDYLARFVGLKSPIPYKFRKYGGNKLRYGMNFAYGGTGVFDTIPFLPNMTTQIDFFEELIKDSFYTKEDLSSSLALVTLSGNDYAAYIITGGSEQGFPAFITSVVNQLIFDVKRLHSLGVKKIVLAGLPPLGCIPRITVATSFQQCNATLNALVNIHNLLLQQGVSGLNNETMDSSFLILDLYTSFTTVLNNNGSSLGDLKFDTPLKPCCTGTSDQSFCGSVDDKGKKLYTICDEPWSAFFWDAAHPTQAGWRVVYSILKSTLNRLYD